MQLINSAPRTMKRSTSVSFSVSVCRQGIERVIKSKVCCCGEGCLSPGRVGNPSSSDHMGTAVFCRFQRYLPTGTVRFGPRGDNCWISIYECRHQVVLRTLDI